MTLNTEFLTNVNSVPLLELASFFSNEIGKLRETKNEKIFQTSVVEYREALLPIQEHSRGVELLSAEDAFNLLFERFIDPIDDILHFMVDDWHCNFSELGLSFQEGIELMPDIAAARKLFPLREDDKSYRCIHCEGNAYGQVWDVDDTREFIEWISSESCVEPMVFLSVKTLGDELIEAFKESDKLAEELHLQEELRTLRSNRHSLVLMYPLLIMELYPDVAYDKDVRHIDTRDIVLPIQYAQYCNKVLCEFSANDLNHSSFLLYLQELHKQSSYEKVPNRNKVEETFDKELEQYKLLLSKFSLKEWWLEYEEAETSFYQNYENLLLCIPFAVGTFDHEDPERYRWHMESKPYMAARRLWDAIPTSPYNSMYRAARNNSLSMETWKEIKDPIFQMTYEGELKAIGAWDYYQEALKAEDTVTRRLALESEELQKHHENLRECRSLLTTVVRLVAKDRSK